MNGDDLVLRRPVAVAIDARGQNPIVVCNDGSVWEYRLGGADADDGWDELPPIPGSPCAPARLVPAVQETPG